MSPKQPSYWDAVEQRERAEVERDEAKALAAYWKKKAREAEKTTQYVQTERNKMSRAVKAALRAFLVVRDTPVEDESKPSRPIHVCSTVDDFVISIVFRTGRRRADA